MKLRRSPFKVDRIESDPNAFGLRAKEILTSLEALFNDRSILITGLRGIGKSSLGRQLQNVLQGDNTLLRRMGLDEQFPKNLCTFYACDENTSLEGLVLDLLYIIENEYSVLAAAKSLDVKPTFEINLGFVKATFEAKTEGRSPATIATQFVSNLDSLLKSLKRYRLADGINIMLDEVDQLSKEINFGHFMKIIHELLNNNGIQEINFIFAGQHGVYTRFIKEDQSFERIIRHIPLRTLESDACNHILSYAQSASSAIFQIDTQARATILAIASGFPYVLHLIGDAAFYEMENQRNMDRLAVLRGIEAILKSDKREKYLSRLRGIPKKERHLLFVLSEYQSVSIPSEIPYEWLIEILEGQLSLEKIDQYVDSLIEKGYLVQKRNREFLLFTEELFRIFINLARMEEREMKLRRMEGERRAELAAEEEKKFAKLVKIQDSNPKDLITAFRSEYFQKQEADMIREEILEMLRNSKYSTAWEEIELQELYDELTDADIDVAEAFDDTIEDDSIEQYRDLWDDKSQLR